MTAVQKSFFNELGFGVRRLIGLIWRLDHQSGLFHDVRKRDISVRGLDVPIRNGSSGQNSPTSARHGTGGKLLVNHRLRFWARQVAPAPPATKARPHQGVFWRDFLSEAVQANCDPPSPILPTHLARLFNCELR